MGNIIAMGGGFGDRDDAIKLAKLVMKLSGKEHPKFLLIPTTSYDFADGGDVSVYAKMGCEIDVLYLTHAYMTEEILAEKIHNADIIKVPGGDLKFCMDTWKKSGADKYLKEAFDDGKVLFGSSSGSMCWFNEGFDDCAPESEFMFVDSLGLLPYCNCPHYETGYWQEFNDYVGKAKYSAIACENETAICYIDGKWSVMVSSSRPDGRVWFFDKEDNFKRYDLTQHPEILERL